MYKYFEAFTNRSGDALPGYFARLFDAGGNQVDIFADNSGTPIVTVSDVANAAKSDENGMFRWYVANGTYDIRFYDANDVFKSAETGVPMYEASEVYTDFSAPDGATRIGEVLDLPDTEEATQADWNRDRISIMRWIPANLHAGIRDRSGTTDLSPYVQAALDNCPAGAALYAPSGTYRMTSGVSCSRSITLAGDPSREYFDNSWDGGRCGTEFDCRDTNSDAFGWAAVNAVNSRTNLTLRNFIVRAARITASGTSGHAMSFNGRSLGGTFLRLDIDNVHVCEAAEHGFYFEGDIYGGTIRNTFANRCGKNGWKTGTGNFGEMSFDRNRIFQNGVTGTTEEDMAGAVINFGCSAYGQFSATENRGPGLIIGGIPAFDSLQLESNCLSYTVEGDGSDPLDVLNRKQVIWGYENNGITSANVTTFLIDPGDDYKGACVYHSRYAGNVTMQGLFANTLGTDGRHVELQAPETVGPDTFACGLVDVSRTNASVFLDNGGGYNIKSGIEVALRHGSEVALTGADEKVAFQPDVLFDPRSVWASNRMTAPHNLILRAISFWPSMAWTRRTTIACSSTSS